MPDENGDDSNFYSHFLNGSFSQCESLLKHSVRDGAWKSDKQRLLDIMEKQQKQHTEEQDFTTEDYVAIRNLVLFTLQNHRKQIDNKILKLETEKVTIPFLKHFRCWLGVCLIFFGFASRFQINENLETPDRINEASFAKQNVSKLVLRNNQYFEILFLSDKVRSDTKPVCYYVGDFLNHYLKVWFFVSRPHKYVFELSHRKWSNSSGDIMDHLQELGIPTWFFTTRAADTVSDKPINEKRIKKLRAIAESATAAFVKYDRDKLQLIGMVSRHSVDVIETKYLKWLNYSRIQNHTIYLLPFAAAPKTNKVIEDFISQKYGLHVVPDTEPTTAVPTLIKVDQPHLQRDFEAPKGSLLPFCSCGQFFEITDYSSVRTLSSCPNPDHLSVCTTPLATDSDLVAESLLPAHFQLPVYRRYNRSIENPTDENRSSPLYPLPDHFSYPENLDVGTIPQQYSTFIGIDISLNGLVVCHFKVGNPKAKLPYTKIEFFYWVSRSKRKFDFGGGDQTKITFTPVQFTSYDDQIATLEERLCKLIPKREISKTLVAAEAPLPDAVHHDSKQKKFISTVTAILNKHRFITTKTDNILIKKVWLLYDWSMHRTAGAHKRLLTSLQQTIADCQPPLKKKYWKLLTYIAWLAKGFPQLGGLGLNEIKQNHEAALLTASKHPYSDVVDSLSIVFYNYLLQKARMTTKTRHSVDNTIGTIHPLMAGNVYELFSEEKHSRLLSPGVDISSSQVYVACVNRATREKYVNKPLIICLPSDRDEEGWETYTTLATNNNENDTHSTGEGADENTFTFVLRTDENKSQARNRFKQEFSEWKRTKSGN